MESQDRMLFRRSWLFAGGFTLLLWLVRAVEWGTATSFGGLGIFPRQVSGMVGILTAPLVHGDFIHLLSNTLPMLLLLMAVFYFYPKIALQVFVGIYLITGFWVWIAAREAYHIGASGLVYGLATFLFFSGVFRRDTRSVAVALTIVFLYSGMLQGLLPGPDPSISWESHLLGAAAGIFCSFCYRGSENGEKLVSPETERNHPVSYTHVGYEYSPLSDKASYRFYANEDDCLPEYYCYQKKE